MTGLDRKALLELARASVWTVGNGFLTAAGQGVPHLRDLLARRFGVQLWAGPSLEPETYPEGFRIRSRGFNVDLLVIRHIDDSGELREYWAAKLKSMAWAPRVRKARFFVTRSAGIWDGRELVAAGDQFLTAANVPGLGTLAIPADDLEAVYRLEPWEFPEAFAGSALADRLVVLDVAGRFHEDAATPREG